MSAVCSGDARWMLVIAIRSRARSNRRLQGREPQVPPKARHGDVDSRRGRLGSVPCRASIRVYCMVQAAPNRRTVQATSRSAISAVSGGDAEIQPGGRGGSGPSRRVTGAGAGWGELARPGCGSCCTHCAVFDVGLPAYLAVRSVRTSSRAQEHIGPSDAAFQAPISSADPLRAAERGIPIEVVEPPSYRTHIRQSQPLRKCKHPAKSS